eukprot:8847949-Pyramimonas_sp.AAC.1
MARCSACVCVCVCAARPMSAIREPGRSLRLRELRHRGKLDLPGAHPADDLLDSSSTLAL